MTEQEVQALLHPHTGEVQVQPVDDGLVLESVLRKALSNTRALRKAISVLAMIAEDDDLHAAYAKNALEEIKATMLPSPQLVTWDHAGPDY